MTAKACALVDASGIVTNFIMADPETDSVPDCMLIPDYPIYIEIGTKWDNGWPPPPPAPSPPPLPNNNPAPQITGLKTV